MRRQVDAALLRDYRVRDLSLAQLTSMAGDCIVIATLPFAVDAMGGTGTDFTAALAVQAAAMAAMFLPAGVIGDRFNRRAMMVTADLMRFVARAFFALLLALGDGALWQLLVVQAVNGTGTALFQATMDGFVPEVFGEEDESRLQRVNALRILALSLGLTLGPAIGGVVFVLGGATAAFAIDAASFLLSAVLIYRLPTPFAKARTGNATLRALAVDAWDGWRGFRMIPWYWRVSVAFAITNSLVLAPYFVIGPQVALQSLGGAAAWSTILVGLGLGELLGALALMVWEPTRPLLVGVGAVAVWVVPLLLMASQAPVVLQAASAICAGCSFAIFGTLWETVKQSHTPSTIRARLASFDGLFSLGPVFLGYILGAALLDAIGFRASLVAMAVVLLLTVTWITLDSRVATVTNGDDGEIAEAIPDQAHRTVALAGTSE